MSRTKAALTLIRMLVLSSPIACSHQMVRPDLTPHVEQPNRVGLVQLGLESADDACQANLRDSTFCHVAGPVQEDAEAIAGGSSTVQPVVVLGVK